MDSTGQTALHIIAKHPRGEEGKEVVWNGNSCSVVDAWLGVARILIDNGCDPRIQDHEGRLAERIAEEQGNYELQCLMNKESETRGNLDRNECIKKFPQLLEASRNGETESMINLLKENVPTLPMSAEADPLHQALCNNHRDAVFLLLCAGSPLCNQYIVKLTPLEMSHHAVGQPALFPALMRKAYADRLADEANRARNKNTGLTCIIENFKDRVIESGDQTRYEFEGNIVQKTTEAKRLLCEAARLGLSLTCQMLIKEDLCLHSCPGEENPLDGAIARNHYDTAYTLCRDLRMTPYKCQNHENAPKYLLDDLLRRDLGIL